MAKKKTAKRSNSTPVESIRREFGNSRHEPILTFREGFDVTQTAIIGSCPPNVGLSLPLVSHGGSGLLAHAIALGLLVNIGLRPGYEVSNEPFRYVVG